MFSVYFDLVLNHAFMHFPNSLNLCTNVVSVMKMIFRCSGIPPENLLLLYCLFFLVFFFPTEPSLATFAKSKGRKDLKLGMYLDFGV